MTYNDSTDRLSTCRCDLVSLALCRGQWSRNIYTLFLNMLWCPDWTMFKKICKISKEKMHTCAYMDKLSPKFYNGTSQLYLYSSVSNGSKSYVQSLQWQYKDRHTDKQSRNCVHYKSIMQKYIFISNIREQEYSFGV